MRLKEFLYIVGVGACLCGCTSVRYVARENNPLEFEELVCGTGWSRDLEGGKVERRVATRETIGAFRVRTNYLYSLLTVVTLGYCMPVDILYEVNHE